VGLQLLLHQALGLGDIFNPGETVLASLVAEADPVHLAGQPFPPVYADLDGKGEPTLDAGMHESKPGIHPVMVEKQALSGPRLEFQFLLLLVPEQLVTLARLHGGQDANQSLADSILLGNLLGQILLARLGGGQVQDGAVPLFGLGQRGAFQLLAFVFTETGEVFQLHPHVPEVVEHPALDGQNPQSASQDQAVEAAQMAEDIFLVLLYKLVHGVLLEGRVGMVGTSNYIPGVTPFPDSELSFPWLNQEVIHSPGATLFN